MRAVSVANIVILSLYFALVMALCYGMVVARRNVRAATDRSAGQAQWEAWRQAAAEQDQGQGPVWRRTPESHEPPTLRLLRDYFATSLIVLVVLTSALYFAFAWMVRGMLLAPSFKPDLAEDSIQRR